LWLISNTIYAGLDSSIYFTTNTSNYINIMFNSKTIDTLFSPNSGVQVNVTNKGGNTYVNFIKNIQFYS